MNNSLKQRWWVRHRILSATLGLVLVVGIFAHFYLHSFLVKYVNRKLDAIPGYHAHLDDIGIHLWRGAYSIEGLQVLKNTGNVPVPFFRAKDIDIAIAWKQLFHRHVVAKIVMAEPQINFVTSPDQAQDQTEIDKSWQTQVKALLPFRLNYVKIDDGSIHFRDFKSDPPMDVYVRQMNIIAENLTNSARLSDTLAATVRGTAIAMKDGKLRFESTADPYEKQPTFKGAIVLEDLSLPQLNSFFKKYAAVEVKDGVFNFYSEVAASKGELQGYAKPIIDGLNSIHLKKEDKTLGEVFKGLSVKLLVFLLTNPAKDRLGTRLEFSGRMDNPDVNVWVAVASTLRNALIRAIPAKLDRALDLGNREHVEIKKINN